MYRAGNLIVRAGKYVVIHDQRHKQDSIKIFKPAPSKCFPSCPRCGEGYPVYKLKALEVSNTL